MGIVVDMTDGIVVWNSAGFQSSIVSAGMPTVVLFSARCGVLMTRGFLKGVLFRLTITSNSAFATASRSGASRHGLQETGGPGVCLATNPQVCETGLGVAVDFGALAGFISPCPSSALPL
jgi:hypothetical protein